MLATTTYAEGLEIKGGYDVWRNLSKDYAGESGGSIDQGWTLGAEYCGVMEKIILMGWEQSLDQK